MASNLKQRLSVAIPVIALLLYILFYHPFLFFILVSVIILRTLWEFFNLYKGKQESFKSSAMLLSILYCYVAWYHPQYTELAVVIALCAFFILQACIKSNEKGMEKISLSFTGFFYICVMSAYTFKLYNLNPEIPMWGPSLVFWSFFICKFSDATAYFGGVRYGKHKMIKRISPNKSWEGLFFGILGGVVPFILIQKIEGFTMFSAFMFCLCVTLAAVIGDLIESMLKREMNVKDAANDIPAFGGTFDMIDSVIISMPLAYYFAYFLIKV